MCLFSLLAGWGDAFEEGSFDEDEVQSSQDGLPLQFVLFQFLCGC